MAARALSASVKPSAPGKADERGWRAASRRPRARARRVAGVCPSFAAPRGPETETREIIPTLGPRAACHSRASCRPCFDCERGGDLSIRRGWGSFRLVLEGVCAVRRCDDQSFHMRWGCEMGNCEIVFPRVKCCDVSYDRTFDCTVVPCVFGNMPQLLFLLHPAFFFYLFFLSISQDKDNNGLMDKPEKKNYNVMTMRLSL